MGEEEGSYQIMPYKEIVALKKDIEELKKKSSGGSAELMETIGKLTKNMDNMLQLFKSAAEEMNSEDNSEGSGKLGKKMDEIIEQNKTIAEAIVALADMIKENLPEKTENEPRETNDIGIPLQRGPPPMPQRMPPPIQMPSRMAPLQMRAPPPSGMPPPPDDFSFENIPPPDFPPLYAQKDKRGWWHK